MQRYMQAILCQGEEVPGPHSGVAAGERERQSRVSGVQSRGSPTPGTCGDRSYLQAPPAPILRLRSPWVLPATSLGPGQPDTRSIKLSPRCRLQHPHSQGATTAPTGCTRCVSGIPVTSPGSRANDSSPARPFVCAGFRQTNVFNGT